MNLMIPSGHGIRCGAVDIGRIYELDIAVRVQHQRIREVITAIKPNLQDKVADKVAGMVDVVARIVADDEVRTFNFKSNEVIFGGGRLRVNAKDIPLDVDALFAVY